MSTRLKPTITADTRFFWEGLEQHKLLIQRCDGCGELRHPPRPMCPQCNSLHWTAVESAGRGTVFSFVMPQHPPYTWFEYPYIAVLVDLDEGVRLVSNLCGIAPDDVTIGMRVEVFYERFDDGLVLPQFRAEVTP
jgi:uncharacterized OB-fold protein